MQVYACIDKWEQAKLGIKKMYAYNFKIVGHFTTGSDGWKRRNRNRNVKNLSEKENALAIPVKIVEPSVDHTEIKYYIKGNHCLLTKGLKVCVLQ